MGRIKQGIKKGGGRNGEFIKRETYYGRIRKDWGDKWMCASFPYKNNKEGSLRNHLSMTRRETQSKNTQCPICQKVQKHMGDIKQHRLERKWRKEGKTKNKAGSKNGMKYVGATP